MIIREKSSRIIFYVYKCKQCNEEFRGKSLAKQHFYKKHFDIIFDLIKKTEIE